MIDGIIYVNQIPQWLGSLRSSQRKRLCGAHNSDSRPPEILNIVEHGTGSVLGQQLIASPGQEREAAVQ